jgi:hypothetical protein
MCNQTNSFSCSPAINQPLSTPNTSKQHGRTHCKERSADWPHSSFLAAQPDGVCSNDWHCFFSLRELVKWGRLDPQTVLCPKSEQHRSADVLTSSWKRWLCNKLTWTRSRLGELLANAAVALHIVLRGASCCACVSDVGPFEVVQVSARRLLPNLPNFLLTWHCNFICALNFWRSTGLERDRPLRQSRGQHDHPAFGESQTLTSSFSCT